MANSLRRQSVSATTLGKQSFSDTAAKLLVVNPGRIRPVMGSGWPFHFLLR